MQENQTYHPRRWECVGEQPDSEQLGLEGYRRPLRLHPAQTSVHKVRRGQDLVIEAVHPSISELDWYVVNFVIFNSSKAVTILVATVCWVDNEKTLTVGLSSVLKSIRKHHTIKITDTSSRAAARSRVLSR